MAIQDTIDEINAALVVLDLQLEGFRDDQRLNIQPNTMTVVNAQVVDYSQRHDLLVAAKTALENLVTDGFPGMPVKVVPQSVYEDLQEQLKSITAALGQVTPEPEAIDLKATVGTPVPK